MKVGDAELSCGHERVHDTSQAVRRDAVQDGLNQILLEPLVNIKDPVITVLVIVGKVTTDPAVQQEATR